MPYGKPNPMTMLPPKAPSALIKTCRYACLISGIVYGAWRLEYLKPVEKKYQEDNIETFAFIRARLTKHEKEKLQLDEVNLQNEVLGKPPIKKEFRV